jgi:predicted nucleic acid-binding protein
VKPTVYLETSIISYLAAHPSRDLLIAANQQATHEWWQMRRERFELVISDVVIQEISAGDPGAASRRREFVLGLRTLTAGQSDAALAARLVASLRLPHRAALDALHVATAAVNGLDYLLTWNCAHIANAAFRHGIESTCGEYGYPAPVICTPTELV